MPTRPALGSTKCGGSCLSVCGYCLLCLCGLLWLGAAWLAESRKAAATSVKLRETILYSLSTACSKKQTLAVRNPGLVMSEVVTVQGHRINFCGMQMHTCESSGDVVSCGLSVPTKPRRTTSCASASWIGSTSYCRGGGTTSTSLCLCPDACDPSSHRFSSLAAAMRGQGRVVTTNLELRLQAVRC